MILGHTLDDILARIHQLRNACSTAVMITDYWNVFEDGDVADADYSELGRAGSDRLTRAVNTVIATSARDSGATFVDLYEPFKSATGKGDPTPLLADDGDHPNPAGHRVIARALLGADVGRPEQCHP